MIVRKNLVYALTIVALLSSATGFAVDNEEQQDNQEQDNNVPGRFERLLNFVNKPADYLLNTSMQDVLNYRLGNCPIFRPLTGPSLWIKALKSGLTLTAVALIVKNEKVQQAAKDAVNSLKQTVGIEVKESCKKSCKRSACKKVAIEEAQENWATGETHETN